MSPSVVPLDQNQEFEAFRKQSEGNKAFNLGGMSDFRMSAPPAKSTAKHGRSGSRTSPPNSGSKPMPQAKNVPTTSRGKDSLDPTSAADLGQSPKRLLSPGSLTYPPERRGSPASMTPGELDKLREGAADRHPRLKLPLDHPTAAYSMPKHRAETVPTTSNSESQLMVTSQYIVNLLETGGEDVLVLDLRVSNQYARSHVIGALSLCIPTTLLKRPSFNVQKLADTFKDEEQKHKFEKWRNSRYIVVYDATSAQLKDATICVNTIKKFKTEGYEGTCCIIKGGFAEFAKRFSSYTETGVESASSSPGVTGDGPKIAPVIGGCPMPATDKPANPFFGNIRQNMDLIGGVGQIALKHPAKATKSLEDEEYPEWLRQASEDKDQGKKISNKFEQIERREKKRMEDALSGKVSFGTPRASAEKAVQIAGLEKGNKNRYNNIWPFEHSRVKLQGVPSHGCDYFNANHIKAAWSNKRYISTQAPIPATFNDFWNVIWQQDVRVIVMLTAEKEGAQVKAHNYWDARQYGPFQLEFLSEKRASLEPAKIHRHRQQRPSIVKRSSTAQSISLAPADSKDDKGGEQPYVTVRKFTLSNKNFPFERMREVTQLQYSSWPDFGAPAHPAHLLGLVEQCDAVVRSTFKSHSGEPEPANNRPVLVHCSAGCGRTGTFCTVDSVIDMLKRQRISRNKRQGTPMDIDQKNGKEPNKSDGGFFASQAQGSDEGIEDGWVKRDDLDLVEKTVEDFRHQRLSMVQSLRQYVLCYESVMEWLVDQQPQSA